jgi:hypothetical protein
MNAPMTADQAGMYVLSRPYSPGQEERLASLGLDENIRTEHFHCRPIEEVERELRVRDLIHMRLRGEKWEWMERTLGRNAVSSAESTNPRRRAWPCTWSSRGGAYPSARLTCWAWL